SRSCSAATRVSARRCRLGRSTPARSVRYTTPPPPPTPPFQLPSCHFPLSTLWPMCQIRWHAPRPSTRETFNDLCYFYAKRSPLTACLCAAGCEGLLCCDLGPPKHQRRRNVAKTTRHDRDHRHALCSLSHGLPAYRRGAHRAIQLALCPRTRRENAAADRGHRPRALHAGRHRGDPRWALLARPELGR